MTSQFYIEKYITIADIAFRSRARELNMPGSVELIRKITIACAIAILIWPSVLSAQTRGWPSRTVTVVVGYAAGGNTDVMARIASKRLSEELKQTFVVENRTGAAGAIAASYVAHAEADGYTLLFGASPQLAIVPYVQKVSYDPTRDFIPVSIFGTGPFILAIKDSIPANTVPEFVRYAKSNKITYGSSGAGSTAHLSGALFVSRAGLDAVHVPFRGGGPAVVALLGGQIDMLFGNAADILPHAHDRLRILAVGTPERMKQLPDVPTIEEFYPNISFPSWNGFLVPAGTPQTVVDTLAKHVIAIAKEPEIMDDLIKLGIDPKGTTPADFTALIKKEQPQFNEAINTAKLSPR